MKMSKKFYMATLLKSNVAIYEFLKQNQQVSIYVQFFENSTLIDYIKWKIGNFDTQIPSHRNVLHICTL